MSIDERLRNQKIVDKLVWLLTEKEGHLASDSEKYWVFGDGRKVDDVYTVIREEYPGAKREIIYEGSDLLVALQKLDELW